MNKKIFKTIYMFLMVGLLASMTTLAFAASTSQDEAQDLVDTAVADGRFTTLATALEAAGLIDTLKGEGPFTVFAPTDEAFAALPEGTLDSLLADPEALSKVLLYHVIAGEVPAADVITLSSADTVEGQPVSITVDGDTVMVGNANVIQTDVMASNGVIHVIDAVLILAEDGAMLAEDEGAMLEEGVVVTSCSEDYVIQADDSLSKIADKFFANPNLYDGIVAATNAVAATDSRYATIDNPGLIYSGQTLCIPATADATVAPVAEAAAGEAALVEEETMVSSDVPKGKSLLSFKNLSSVDLVLDLSGPMFDTAVVPPAGAQEFILEPGSYSYIGHQPGGGYSVAPGDFTMVAGQALELVCYDGGSCTVQRPQVVVDDSAAVEEEAAPASLDIVDTAVADGRFTTLATALEAAGLIDTLKGEGPFTVFAPTDEAFAALPEGTLDSLLADPTALADVLLYHVVAGEVLAADVVALDSADTVEGQPLSILVDGDSVMVGDANIILTDVMASNGVIHVIDAVLLPPTETASE